MIICVIIRRQGSKMKLYSSFFRGSTESDGEDVYKEDKEDKEDKEAVCLTYMRQPELVSQGLVGTFDGESGGWIKAVYAAVPNLILSGGGLSS